MPFYVHSAKKFFLSYFSKNEFYKTRRIYLWRVYSCVSCGSFVSEAIRKESIIFAEWQTCEHFIRTPRIFYFYGLFTDILIFY